MCLEYSHRNKRSSSQWESYGFLLTRGLGVFSPLLLLFGFLKGGGYYYFTFFSIVFFCLFSEFIADDLKLQSSSESDRKTFSGIMQHPLFYQAALVTYAFLHLTIIPAIVFITTTKSFKEIDGIGLGLSIAVVAGSMGGITGHELVHRSKRWERILGTLIFATMNYAHFRIAHVEGHHRNAGLFGDWNTARRGESFYQYFPRAVLGGLKGSWNFEIRRATALGKNPFGLSNFFVRYALIQAVIYGAMLKFLDRDCTVLFVGYSFATIVLFESFNYVTHYGLVREKNSKGEFEPLQGIHSWDFSNKVSNWFFFNAGKHRHHHAEPNVKYEDLKIDARSEFLPHGIIMMAMIALIPSFYFKMMEPLLQRIEQRKHEPIAASSA